MCIQICYYVFMHAFKKLSNVYSKAKNFGGNFFWLIGTQNSFNGENFGGLTVHTEENQEKLADKTLANYNHQSSNSPRFFATKPFLYGI